MYYIRSFLDGPRWTSSLCTTLPSWLPDGIFCPHCWCLAFCSCHPLTIFFCLTPYCPLNFASRKVVADGIYFSHIMGQVFYFSVFNCTKQSSVEFRFFQYLDTLQLLGLWDVGHSFVYQILNALIYLML